MTTRGGVVLPSLNGETATHLLVFAATTVDGSEIRRSPVEVGSLSYNHIIYKVYISQVVSRISEPSTVGCGFKRYLLQHAAAFCSGCCRPSWLVEMAGFYFC